MFLSVTILLLSTADQNGGAATAAKRLLDALRKGGIDANMLVRDKTSDDPFVYATTLTRTGKMFNFIRFAWERLVIFICNKGSKKNLFKISIANTGINISQHPLVQHADVIHLHWINQGFLSLNNIQQLINLRKPIVWTMHDLWQATSICHYPGNCIKYQSDCYQCPMMQKSPTRDLAQLTQKKKQNIELEKITFVGCSQWIVNMAQKSSLIRNASLITIPNPINLNVFKLICKTSNSHTPMLFFAAAKLTDERKGVKFLIEACKILKNKHVNLEIMLMGNSEDELEKMFPFKVHKIGFVNDTKVLVNAYNAANLFVIPSLEDNLPNTVMEAMACGVPCVGFNVGGIPEMIEHKVNGYVAEYQNVNDLANGIQWCIKKENQETLIQNVSAKAKKCYEEKIVAKQYVQLYEKLIEIH
jgi:glycosyltransferase involved in cell wall biosynthesis